MKLLDPGFSLTLRPMRYPQFYSQYKQSIANTWSVEEVDFSSDLVDLREKVTPAQRHLIQRLVAFFATGDNIVANNLVLTLYKHINAPEARLFLSRQLFEEAQHIDCYLTILDAYLPSDEARQEAFKAVENIPSIQRKAQFCWNWTDQAMEFNRVDTVEKRRSFLMTLMSYAAGVEGLFFFGAFAYVYYLRSQGLFHGLATATNWIFREETCVTPETEVLTPDGWVEFQKLGTQQIAQFDLLTEDINFVTPLHIVKKPYSGKMVKLFHKKEGISQVVTTDHDVVQKWDNQVSWRKDKACEFTPNPKKMIPLSGHLAGQSTLTPEDKFLLAFQINGSISPSYNSSQSGPVPMFFILKPKHKVVKFRGLIEQLDWQYKEKPSGAGKTKFEVFVPVDFKVTKNLDDWLKLSSRDTYWLLQFIEELRGWSNQSPNASSKTLHYTTSNVKNAELVQTAASLCGRSAYIRHNPNLEKTTTSNSYIVDIRASNVAYTGSLHKEEFDYDGLVYCATVPSGAILIRHNGKISVTGNCHMNFAFECVRIIRQEEPELFDSQFEARVKIMIKQAVDVEYAFAEEVLIEGVAGLSLKDMKQYLEYVADSRLVDLGYERMFNAKNPFDFMELQDVQEVTNFFERRVSAYQVGVTGEVSFDEEF